MHWEQFQFLRAAKELLPEYFSGVAVLEIGSYDVNGSNRSLFTPTRYIGVDLIDGPGVDYVGLGHLFRSRCRFDVVISTECFEHDPFYVETLANMLRHTRRSGMVLFTCASTDRAEHGTPRAAPGNSPGTVAVGYNYYRNLTEEDFVDLPLSTAFAAYRFFGNASSHDLYFLGITIGKAGKRDARNLQFTLDALEAQCALIEGVSFDCEAALKLMRQDRAAEGINLIQRALERVPSAAWDYLLGLQGWLLLEDKRGQEAEAAVRTALTLSDRADLHLQLATILDLLGRSSEAVEPALRAIERAPTDAKCRYFLGAILQKQNRLQDAEQMLVAALGLDPRLAPACQQISLIRFKQQRWAEAVGWARRAVELAPNEGWIRTHFDRLTAQLSGFGAEQPPR